MTDNAPVRPLGPNDIRRAEFLARLDELIEFARTNTFRGSAAAYRALKRVRSLAALK